VHDLELYPTTNGLTESVEELLGTPDSAAPSGSPPRHKGRATFCRPHPRLLDAVPSPRPGYRKKQDGD